jgi:hypothetical protein
LMAAEVWQADLFAIVCFKCDHGTFLSVDG